MASAKGAGIKMLTASAGGTTAESEGEARTIWPARIPEEGTAAKIPCNTRRREMGVGIGRALGERDGELQRALHEASHQIAAALLKTTELIRF